MLQTRACPALMIAAPASGQGKTTVTAALARLWARRGQRVRVFKCGSDFIDPHWHALASGRPVHNVDLWLNGESDLRLRLYDAAGDSDLILIEGVMGLFDSEPSAADLSVRLGIPVMAVIDASAMAGTFGALAHGLRHYRPGLPWAGVMANRVGSAGHAQMLQQAVHAESSAHDELAALDAGWLGALHRDERFTLPERHLGLMMASELPDAMARLDAMADALAETPLGQLDIAGLIRWSVPFTAQPQAPVARLLEGRCIAVARDAAFCFIYQANLDTLHQLGAELTFFSPLADEPLPHCDAVWMPGGYPELHAKALSAAQRCQASLEAHVASGKAVWAECGGMMPLFEGLTLSDGTRVPMWGILPGEVRMQARLAALGPQQWQLPEGALRGHTFHFSKTETTLTPVAYAELPESSGSSVRGEPVYAKAGLRASYYHAWFPSSPEACASLFMPEDS